MKKGEFWISIITISLCVLFLWMLSDFPSALTNQDLGPAFFPGIILSFLLILSVIQLVISIRGKEIKVKLIEHKLQITAIFSLFLYIFLIPVVGYAIITPIFLVILTRLFNIKKWFVNITYSFILSGLIWYFFEKISGVPLPSGILMS